jgi:hypothetical protein
MKHFFYTVLPEVPQPLRNAAPPVQAPPVFEPLRFIQTPSEKEKELRALIKKILKEKSL